MSERMQVVPLPVARDMEEIANPHWLTYSLV
jgi:hypothetical protein